MGRVAILRATRLTDRGCLGELGMESMRFAAPLRDGESFRWRWFSPLNR
jgi:hypothetical protein